MSPDQKIKTVRLSDPEYPPLLKEIHKPPALLYYRGTLPQTKLNLAVVGSRKATDYGLNAVDEIILPLRGQDISIVSGLAYGIDTRAHQAALKCKLNTVAVLGSGLDWDSLYPYPNKNLAEQILSAGGCLISEFPPGTRSRQAHFPMRNRIISGMSRAIIIIEAGVKSGALITGKLALDQNRDIFAVPGNIFEENCCGTNYLIKCGAKPITSAEDILSEYSLKAADTWIENLPDLSESERIILKHLTKKPQTINLLIERTGIAQAAVNSALTMLEIKNLIKVFPDEKYASI